MSLLDKIGKKNKPKQVFYDTEKQQRYDALVTQYYQELFRYGYWLTRDKQVAEDLVQETCLRAWKSLDSLQDPKAAKPWLIKILRRENARRFQRKQFDLVNIDDEPEAGYTSDDAHHQHQWLQKQIMQLETEYREPLFLQVIAGFSGDEIAQILELNKNTVMTRLFRARNQLKQRLDSMKAQATPNDADTYSTQSSDVTQGEGE
ncbi:MAG: sigma-70 family RNA polymerase sigma factor [Vibrio sp.]